MKKVAIGLLVAVTAVLCLSMALGNWELFLMMALIGAGIALPFNHFKIKSKWLRYGVGIVVFCLVYFLVIYPVLDQWMVAHYPGTWRALQLQIIHHDLENAEKYSVAGNGIKGVTLHHAKIMDNATKKQFIDETQSFIDKVAQGIEPSRQDTLDYLSAQQRAEQKRQTTQVIMSGGLIMSPASASGTQSYGNYHYLEVDVKNPEGATFEVPAGMTAEVSIDSAWYTCNFSELRGFGAPYCNGNGYGVVPATTTGGQRERVNRFLNKDESMGAVVVFNGLLDTWISLPMGQTIVVSGEDIVVSVNDWVGDWFGGKGGSFTASKDLRRGGFFDNRGYLRVLIVLKP